MIYIRTDANEIIATGHVMRCLTIAEEIVSLGGSVRFVVSDQQSLPLIQERNFDYIVMNDQWNHVCLQEERRQLSREMTETDWLLVDSYYIHNDYLEAMRELCKVATFDDMFDEKKDADMIINYNVFYREFDYAGRYEGCDCRLLLGEKYVPLRKQFYDEAPQRTNHDFLRQRVLLLCGGTDKYNIVNTCLQYIKEKDIELFNMIEWQVVAGACSFIDDVTLRLNNVHMYRNVTDMSMLMKKTDICLTAASTVLYESCCMLLPTIFFTCARDQKLDVPFWSNHSMMLYCGDLIDKELETLDTILVNLRGLVKNREKQEYMRDLMSGKIDGKGAERICRCFLGEV